MLALLQVAQRISTSISKLLMVGCLAMAGLSFADTRIVLDVSKSMAENDPENFRTEAIELLIEGLATGEKAGIWTFGQYVNLLMPHQSVNAAWKQQALSKVRQQNAPAIRSNFGRALEEVSYDFLYSSYKGPTQVFFITDGRVDIAPNTEVNRVERERILTQLLPKFAAVNAQIHTIVLSDDADHSLLKQLSAQTGGRYQAVKQSSELTQIMLTLNDAMKPASQIPMSAQSFNVDASIRELTVLMYHDSGSVALVSPAGSETSAVSPANQRWRVGRGFSQVSINSPQTGQWQVKGQVKDASNIQVISDINLSWQKPEAAAIAQGEVIVIEAQLLDENGQSISDDLASLINAELRIDGMVKPLQIQGDKIVARVAADQSAQDVLIELSVDGGTFNRLMTRTLRFVEPYISEVLLTEQGYEWRLYPNRYLAQTQQLDAVAEYQMNGTTRRGAFEQSKAGYYVWVLPYDIPAGQYEVELKGKLDQMGADMSIPVESVMLMIPPSAQSGYVMSPDVAPMMTPMSPAEPEQPAAAFIKDPINEFPELQADLVVNVDNTEGWDDQPDPAPSNEDGLGIGTYLLLSIPGLLVLVGAYLVYRRIEQKAKASSSEEELMLGGDEFSGLDDIDALAPDADLDISDLEGDGDDQPPMIDEIIEDLPTPSQTEAPTPADEVTLDAQTSTEEAEPDTEEDPEEELFDISSIDDDLADLDLALDGDDPFADDDEKT